jgi:hypothetical protein
MHFKYQQETPEMLTSLMNTSLQCRHPIRQSARMVCTSHPSCRPHSSLLSATRCIRVKHLDISIQTILDSDPGNRNDNVHALLLRAFPLVAECAVLLVVPVGADGAVHAAAAVLLWF